jgi:hypothetical protein
VLPLSSTETSGSVTVEVDFTGGYPLWLAAAGCLNELYREARGWESNLKGPGRDQAFAEAYERAAAKGTGEIMLKDGALRTWREVGACATVTILIVRCVL